MKNLGIVGVLIAVLILIFWLLQGTDPSDCPIPFPVVNAPSAALVTNLSTPSSNFTTRWQWTDRTNLGGTQWTNPGDFDGIAFQSRVARYPVGDFPRLITTYVFEFDVPPPGCDVSMEWSLDGRIRFPEGLCARPLCSFDPFTECLIQLGCTDDNFTGIFWIDALSFSTMNEPGIVQGNSYQTLRSLSNNAVQSQLLWIDPRTTPPLGSTFRYEGNLDIEQDMPSRVYVGISLWMEMDDNAEICIGDSCVTTNDNLIEQAVFSTSPLSIIMFRE